MIPAPPVEPEPPPPATRRLGLLLLVVALAAACPAAARLATRLRLAHHLETSRPAPSMVARGLASEDPELVGRALGCLDLLPPDEVARLLHGAPFGRSAPLDALAPPVLRRRGDLPARRALARVRSR